MRETCLFWRGVRARVIRAFGIAAAMAFLKDHLPPMRHNAAGSLLAAGIVAVVASAVFLIEQLREPALTFLNFRIPMYPC